MTGVGRLPAGWTHATLAEVADINMGQSPPGSTYNLDGRGLPFFQGKAEFGSLYPTAKKWCSKPTKIAERGDVLISVRAPVGPTNLADQQLAIGRGLAAIRPRKDVPSLYVLYALRASEQRLRQRATGTTFDAISGRILREHEIWLAPVGERVAIVKAIEQQLSRVDAATESLQTALRKLQRYRRLVLQVAIDDGALLGPSLALGEVADIQGGIQKQPKRAPRVNHYPFLRVANVLRGRLDLRDVHRVELFGNELDRLRLHEGDLLIVEGNGSQSQIGRMAVWDGSIPDTVHQNHIIRARLGPQVLPEWAQIVWNSHAGQGAVRTVASSTSGLYTLSVSKVGRITIPVPSLADQSALIAEVQRALSISEQMEAEMMASIRRAAVLERAILIEAFAGRLA